jgi:hypothetical protein
MSNETLQSILGSKTVSFYAIFAKALGSVQSAVMLSQAFFWQEKARFKSECIEIKGKMFFKKTAEEWYEETGLTQEQQSTARAKLSKCGVMLSELAGLPASLHYWVDMEAVVKMVEQYLKENKKAFADKRTEKRDKKRRENGKFEKTSNGKEPEHSFGTLPKQESGIIPEQVDHILPQQETVKNGNIYNIESLESKKESKKESAPQAAFITTHTPTKVENIEVVIVEGQTFDLEEKTNLEPITPAAGPLSSDECEALQEQSADEARQVFDAIESQAQSTYDFYASLEAEKKKTPPIPAAPLKEKEPRKPRATKPAADRSAEIPGHLKTDELRAFFAAIRPEWLEWVKYKVREKKGRYESAETEAIMITSLARKTGYDPAAAALAIEHSIGGQYQGIFMPKADGKPQASPAPRYSFQDAPQAHTTQELLTEMRMFYKANTGELTGTQAAAGTAYTDNRLTEAVTAFCAHRVSVGRAAETFERQNAALCKWLQEEKKRDAAKVAGPGPQTVQYSTRAAAPIRYAKQEEI